MLYAKLYFFPLRPSDSKLLHSDLIFLSFFPTGPVKTQGLETCKNFQSIAQCLVTNLLLCA